VESPLSFVHATSALWSGVELPIHEGDVFTAEAFSEGTTPLRKAVSDRLGDTGRFKAVSVTAHLRNCKDNNVDVVYRVLFFNFPQATIASPEVRRSEIERSGPVAAENNVQGRFKIVPILGFDNNRHLTPGTQASLALKGTPFERVDLAVSASGSSLVGHAGVQGTGHPKLKFIDLVNYQIGYDRSDLPSSLAPIRKSLLNTSFIGESKPIALDEAQNNNIKLRYAAALEAGNEHMMSSITTALPASGYGALKIAAGVTGRFGRQSSALSYGLAMGESGRGLGVDFIKNVVEASWSSTFRWPWLAKDNLHFPAAVEVRFGAGTINVRRQIPTAEFFFGGNSVGSFLPVGDWEIRDGPLIRSIAQNRFIPAGGGADNFAAMNVTFAPTLLAKSLVPQEILKSPDFPGAKKMALNSAVQFEKILLLGQDPAAKAAAKKLDGIGPDLDSLALTLTALRMKDIGAAETLRDKAERAAEGLRMGIESARKDASTLAAVPGQATTLWTALDKLKKSIVSKPSLDEENAVIALVMTHLAAFQKQIRLDWNSIDQKTALEKAKSDIGAVAPILDVFLNELNAFALAPVFLFDAAREHPDPFGTRYGIGSGIRVTVLNMNLTFGYSFNPRPLPTLKQGRGEPFVAFQLSDIFHGQGK
jgi:hypothetical protein